MKKDKLMAKSIDMDDLDQVAGGNEFQCLRNMRNFYKLGIKTFSGDKMPTKVTQDLLDGLEAAFSYYGVQVEFNMKGLNLYYINGEFAIEEKAWNHVLSQDPKHFIKNLDKM